MSNIFKAILDCRSGFHIEHLIEDALPNASKEDKVILEKMNDITSLDEIHILAADALGLHETSKQIRDFCNKKAKRVTPTI